MVNSVVTGGIASQLVGIIKSVVVASKITVIIPTSAAVDELIVKFLLALV
jgi:deoxyhypusine synthase